MYVKECVQIRSDIDEQHKIRMEAFEFKITPIVIKDEPSKKANYKIQGAKLQYDIYALCLRLRDTTFRAEHEEKVLRLSSCLLFSYYCSEKRAHREGGEQTQRAHIRPQDSNIHHHQRSSNV